MRIGSSLESVGFFRKDLGNFTEKVGGFDTKKKLKISVIATLISKIFRFMVGLEITNKAMPVATTVEIPTLIRTLRQRLGLSQRQFGEQLGVVFQTVNNWENGRTQPTRMALMVIRRQLEEMGEEGADLLEKYFNSEF